jgi:hypothetical protein
VTQEPGGGASNPPIQRASADHDAVIPAESAAAPHPQPGDGLFPAPQQNPLHLTVFCRYCREPRHHPCRHTMLPGRPVTTTHQHRIDDAEGTPF